MSDIFDNPRRESDASARYAAREFIDRIKALEADLAAAREEIARLAEDSERIMVTPRSHRVTFNQCPVGLFLHGDTLALMTEYSTNGRRDAYLVESGEYFWGGVHTARERSELLVTPCAAARAGGTR